MIGRLGALDPRQRTVLGVVTGAVVVVALLLGLTLLTGDDDGGDRLDTAAGSSTSSSTSTGVSTSSTLDGSSTTAPVASSTTTAADGAARSTSTTVRRAPAGGGGTGGGDGSAAPRSTTSTTRRAATTTTVPRPTGSCAGVSGTAPSNDLAQRFCAHRANAGLPTMVRTAALNAVAQEWADKLAADHDLSHRSSADMKQRTLQACSRCTGWAENVAFAMDTGAIWSGWLGSATHRGNIEHGAAGEYGMAVARSADGYLWAVQNFGRYP